jgi:hypothetical protein
LPVTGRQVRLYPFSFQGRREEQEPS